MKRTFPCLVPALRRCLTILAFGSLLLWLPYLPIVRNAHADSITAISPTGGTGSPASLGTIITSGTTSHIPTNLCTADCVITGGHRAGSNLFHSFGDFNIGTLDSARFQTGLVNPLPDATVSNIIARVTGGPSNLFGNLDSATYYPSANLFLMNPAGFLFGPNVTVNVGGMVAFTTADYLRLTGDVRFNAIPDVAVDVLLSAAPVAAFGFIGSNPGAITIQGSQFSVTDGQSISLISGNITIEPGMPDGGATTQPARLSAPNGKIQLASAASPGEFDALTLQPLPNVNGASFTSFGSATLAAGSTVNVSGTNAVSIRDGQFVLSVNDAVLTTVNSVGSPETISLTRGSSIVTANTGTEPGVDMLLAASTIQLDGASIRSTTSGDGSGGNITIQADQIALSGGTQVITSTEGAGTGGTVALTATDSIMISGFDSEGTLVSAVGIPSSGLITLASGSGAGGDVTVSAPSLTVENNGLLMSLTSGDGHGGNLSLTGNTIVIQNEAYIFSSAGQDIFTGEIMGRGAGGNINLSATDSIRIVGTETPTFLGLTAVTSQSSNTGDTGNISVSAPIVALEHGGFIETSNGGTGAEGNISISAPTSLTITGTDQPDGQRSRLSTIASLTEANGGSIAIEAGSVLLSDLGSINTVSFGFGSSNPGDINLHVTGDLSATDGASIYSSGAGNSSGTISISADQVLVSSSQPFVPSQIVNSGGAVSTGNIEIVSRVISVRDDARINMEGIGQLGTISLAASEAVTVATGAKLRMENSSGASETVGSINVSAPNITLDQAIIQTWTVGAGDAGSVNLVGDRIALSGGQIKSETQQIVGRGGDVTVTAQESLLISGRFAGNEIDGPGPAGIFTSTHNFGGDAGNINARAPQVQITDGGVLSATSTGSGNAGNITVQGLTSPAQSILINGAGTGVFTDTQGSGKGGAIFMNANSLTLQNGGTLSAATSGTASSATGGAITVNANQVQFNNGGLITASTTGAGAGGSINLNAGNTFASNASTVSSTATQAMGGDINIAAGQSVALNNGSSISASSTGIGNAGDIVIEAGQNYMSTNSAVTTQATHASGGDITVNATIMVQLINSQINASVEGSSTTVGGNIKLDPLYVILQNSQILAQATQGQGGAISINITDGGLYLPDATSTVSASSQFGVNGTVTIQSPNAPISGQIQPLGGTPLPATSLLNQRCASLAGGEFSSFTVAGRDSLPTEPGGWLSSPLAALSAGTGLAARGEGERPVASEETPLLSLRQIAPPGFLTQTFAVDWSASCTS